MRIGIDIRSLLEKTPSGVSAYTRNLLAHLFKRFPEESFVLFWNQWRRADLPFDVSRFPNVEIHQTRLPNKILHAGFAVLKRPTMDRLIGPVDLLFFPNIHFAAWSPDVSVVLTVHDLFFDLLPSAMSLFRRQWHAAIRPAALCRRANHVIAISEQTAMDLNDRYHLAPDRMTVIGEGVDEMFFQPPMADALHRVSQNYRLPARYVLLLSNQEQRKNIDHTIRAFLTWRERRGAPVDLVIAGGQPWGSSSYSIASHPAIHRLGYVASEDRPALYAQAQAFCFLSHYEGFGLPPLEAMAMGAPVIASHSSSLPEVCADAALLIDPYRAEEFGRALDLLMNNFSLRRQFIQRGKERSRCWSWDAAADATMNVFRQTAYRYDHAHRH